MPGEPVQAPARARFKLVVSDFHLGTGRYSKDGTQNILEDFVYDREFAEFLTFYRSGSFAESDVELVLNGDILNLLQIDSYGVHTHLFTERAVTRAVERIIEGHPEFFEALRKFVAVPGHTVSYVVGNHDMGMLWTGPRNAFSVGVGAPVTFHDVSYRVDGLHIEHGQQFERFARTDLSHPFITRGLPEPVLNLPWSSIFVATLLPRIKQERPHCDKVKPISSYMRWIFIHDFWWAVKSWILSARFLLDTIVWRTRYRIRHSIGYTLGMIREITIYPTFDKFAFKILEESEETHTVIFGHTHCLRYKQWREGKEYFNEGTWNEATNLELGDFGTQIRLTYAFIEFPPAARPKTRLKQWKGIWKPEMDVLA